MKDTWENPTTVKRAFLDFCAEAACDDAVFESFRRHPACRWMMEHVTEQQGQHYLEAALAIDEKFVKKNLWVFRQNDAIGMPGLARYHQLDSLGTISPTTLRYAYIATDLASWVGSLDDLDIVEIGGGYGGLAAIICRVFRCASYTIFDLEPVNRLAEKYLACLDVSAHHLLPHDDITHVDVAISTWALSELSHEAQQTYFDKIISKSRYGYVKYNTDTAPLIEFLERRGADIEVVPQCIASRTTTVRWRCRL